MATTGTRGDQSRSRLREVTLTAGIGLAGYLAMQLGGVVFGNAVALVTIVVLPVEGLLAGFPGIIVGSGIGAAIFVAGYIARSRHDWSFIDVAMPSGRDLAYAVGVIGVLLVALIGVSQVLEVLGVEPSPHDIEQTARDGDPRLLLLLIPLTILVIGPAEEVLFRNILQKRLSETISVGGAIAATSVLFALVHLPAYATSDSLLQIGSSLGVVFVLSILLGYSYVKTQNIVVPSIAHGVFNAFQFGILYLQIA